MDIKAATANAATLMTELQWLKQVIDTRMNLYWQRESAYTNIYDIPAAGLSDDPSMYAQVVQYYNLDMAERIILLLALAPHIMPHLLDIFFIKNADYDRGFTEFGGRGHQHGGFVPTGETAAFILAANDLSIRFQLLKIFSEDHLFTKFNILKLAPLSGNVVAGEPYLSGAIVISDEYLSYFTRGESHKPDFSMHFPAKRLTTGLSWDNLVLADETMDEIGDIRDWLQYGDVLMNEWGMRKKIKPGYRSLFYGPPGTGKTLTASLLGKSVNLDVYRIDLSMVVSKYIGETEKNLAGVFDQAEHKNWILFFDEADALFGKRTQTSSSNDRYANQEVSYLLQRIEDFPGVVILATNFKANIDDAFSRRFQSMIHFCMPGPAQRLRLWQQGFHDNAQFEEQLDWDLISGKYEMSGGAIMNVVRYASLAALKRNSHIILLKDVLQGIRREFGKEGKMV
jgi:hypothetical protein